jgi:hypothetical protein
VTFEWKVDGQQVVPLIFLGWQNQLNTTSKT